uniref:RRM domain-containing protein n=1 Tax=Macrostomum lignano TaxID=282301 RepID=A0A1I8HCP3_9PLAT
MPFHLQHLTGTGQSQGSCIPDCTDQQDCSESQCSIPNDVISQPEKRLKKSDINDSRYLLWVSNLADEVKAAHLKELFSQYGRVVSTKIVARAVSAQISDDNSSRQERCGLVQLASAEEVDRCQQQLNQLEFHGQQISVARSPPVAPRQKNADKEACKNDKVATGTASTVSESLPDSSSDKRPDPLPESKKQSPAANKPPAPGKSGLPKSPNKSQQSKASSDKSNAAYTNKKPSSSSSAKSASASKPEKARPTLLMSYSKQPIPEEAASSSGSRSTKRNSSHSAALSRTSGAAARRHRKSRLLRQEQKQSQAPYPDSPLPDPPAELDHPIQRPTLLHPAASVRSDDLRHLLESARCARGGATQQPSPLMSLGVADSAQTAPIGAWHRQQHHHHQSPSISQQQELLLMQREIQREHEQLEAERRQLQWERERALSEERRVMREQEDFRRMREQMERELRDEWERKKWEQDQRSRKDRNPRSRSRSRSGRRASHSTARSRPSPEQPSAKSQPQSQQPSSLRAPSQSVGSNTALA